MIGHQSWDIQSREQKVISIFIRIYKLSFVSWRKVKGVVNSKINLGGVDFFSKSVYVSLCVCNALINCFLLIFKFKSFVVLIGCHSCYIVTASISDLADMFNFRATTILNSR